MREVVGASNLLGIGTQLLVLDLDFIQVVANTIWHFAREGRLTTERFPHSHVTCIALIEKYFNVKSALFVNCVYHFSLNLLLFSALILI